MYQICPENQVISLIQTSKTDVLTEEVQNDCELILRIMQTSSLKNDDRILILNKPQQQSLVNIIQVEIYCVLKFGLSLLTSGAEEE